MDKYQNSNIPINDKVADLIKSMTLKEKVGQLNQKMYGWQAYHKVKDGFELTTAFKKHVAKFDGMGALYGLFRADPWSGADFSNGIPAEDSATVSNMIQDYINENTRLGIPVLLSEESPHGHQALGSTLFPTNIASGSTWNPALQKQASAYIADELYARGVHLGLVSVLDVVRDPRWGRTEECFSEDPYLTSRMAEAIVEGMQGVNTQPKTIPVLKHFAAQGAGAGGLNSGPALIGERELREIYLPPMQAGVKAGAMACMAAYNEIDGVPCHTNEKLLTDILRKEWGFNGIVMADGQALDRLLSLTGDKELAAAYSLQAGVDLSLWDDVYLGIETGVKHGKIPEELVDRAVSRILNVKFTLGLFDNRFSDDTTKSLQVIGCSKHKRVSLEMAKQSAVLLKNDNILPLNKHIGKIAVIGPNADNIYNMLGDYTPPQREGDGVTVLEGIRSIVQKETEVLYARGCGIRDSSKDGFYEAKEKAQQADVAIVVLGGSSTRDFNMAFENNGGVITNDYSEMDSGENVDVADLNLGGVQAELVQEIANTGTPVITVFIQGRPHSITNVIKNSQAGLLGWYPGPQGGNAIAEILFGDVNPSGKLPVSIPISSMQLPVYYNYKNSGSKSDYYDMSGKPLYPFGHGLSYTTFEYRFVNKSMERITLNDLQALREVKINIEVKNTGATDGYEVVQLYSQDLQSSVTQRIKALKGFQKVWVNAGETKQITFSLGFNELAIWNLSMEAAVEPGTVKLMVGGSSKTKIEKDLLIE